ncbi:MULTISPECIES: HAD family hydrolase [unclassified Mesorhizobium]|uniref:HAD family hydrolase n=1 Tax=unclassified Mesorhizobium TaxID=325217 RepID=UPI001CC8F873|nr:MULTISPECIES: HAD family phosphatase [unclassified Mesorhizobium]MBZ9916172.1 HAD family phosphatase [Mesorhizobium sp. BR1-1-7]MBZ9955699.1 HAD family phosphatase [Mesorhizobium sp. BR1-1-15]MBZ9972457.1 HAD family phosphatase [Mesorhizobium sp. BR1-1-12]
MQDTLIIFDCDGVLVDSEPLAALAYGRVYSKHGMELDPQAVLQCVGMKQTDILERIRLTTGHRLEEHQTTDLWDEVKALFTESLQPMAGLKPFLEQLSNPRCVASSSSLERIHHSLSVTGLARFFGENIFSSSMVARGKPAPDIFLFAADQMSIEPKHCAVVEDSPFGVQGAVAAGMTAIGFIGGGHTYPGHTEKLRVAGARTICADWDEVARELVSLELIAPVSV